MLQCSDGETHGVRFVESRVEMLAAEAWGFMAIMYTFCRRCVGREAESNSNSRGRAKEEGTRVRQGRRAAGGVGQGKVLSVL